MDGNQYETAKTAVFWDVEDCQIPDGLNAVVVSKNIRSALEKMNYRGTSTIYAFGDTTLLQQGIGSSGIIFDHEPAGDEKDLATMDYRGTSSLYAYVDTNQSEDGLESTGIMVNHTPAGDRDARLDRILLGCFEWAMDNPAPANVMFILGDLSGRGEYITAFYQLRYTDYNVLLAQPRNASGQLSGHVSSKWLWESLSFGKDPLDDQSEPLQPVVNTSVVNKRSPIGFLLAGAGALVWIAITWTRLSQLSLRSY